MLNNIFEQILPNGDNNIETDMISQDIYLTTDEFNELCNKGNVKKLFYNDISHISRQKLLKADKNYRKP